VANFGASEEKDAHFCIDDATGTVLFGPRIRSPRGIERQYGAVPPAGRKIRFTRYRSGGGVIGNVPAERLTMLKSSNAYIDQVTNHAPAIGGTDAEEIEHAKWRGPHLLLSTDRAVTADDFEALSLEATSEVARARCLPVRDAGDPGRPPGVVQLLLVPGVTVTDRPLLPEHLDVPDRVRRVVLDYLDERRLLTCDVRVDTPEYTWVRVSARLLVRPEADRARVARDAAQELYRYLHPVVGGPEEGGWPFGRSLFVAEIYPRLQQVSGVDTIDGLTLHQVDPATGEAGPEVGRISIPADGLICSAAHQLTVNASETRWGGRRGRSR
jgi:predicted phage baseplate assembly protein